METRDWSSTEFVACAVVLVGVWTTGLRTGASLDWTIVVTTGLTIVYVLARGFGSRQSTRPSLSRSELFLAGGQILAVAMTAAADKVPVATALAALALTIAAYAAAAMLQGGRNVRSATAVGVDATGPGLGMKLMPYDPPLSPDAGGQADRPASPDASTQLPSGSEYQLRIERRVGGSLSVFTSSRAGGSVPIAHQLSGEQLAQFMDARTAPIADRARSLDRLQSGREFRVRTWKAVDVDAPVSHIQRGPERGEAVLLSAEGLSLAHISAETDDEVEDLESFHLLLEQFGLPIRVIKVDVETALLRAASG